MKSKKRLLVCFILSLLVSGAACSKEEVVFQGCNSIFTEGFYDEVQEIIYWVGDTKHIIKDEMGCGKIVSLFSALTLTEIIEDETSELVYGFIPIDFVTEVGTTRITMRAGYINIDSASYRVDKDILEEIREIVFADE